MEILFSEAESCQDYLIHLVDDAADGLIDREVIIDVLNEATGAGIAAIERRGGSFWFRFHDGQENNFGTLHRWASGDRERGDYILARLRETRGVRLVFPADVREAIECLVCSAARKVRAK